MPFDRAPRLLLAVLTLGFVHPVAGVGRAAEPASPAWGRLDADAGRPGRFTFVVTAWPDQGGLAVPAGFPQIIRATASTESGPRDLRVEYNGDATMVAVVAPDGMHPASVEVETAEDTTQFADGRIVLTARSAVVDGATAKLESHPGNHRIGFWSNPADGVSWTWQPTRWGAYDARLTYSTASPSGGEIELVVGGTTLPGRLESTGSWYRY
ncbi:MAG: hypothetical protein ACKOEM_22570, partial [Planctomycetia bacterium]